MVSLYLSENTVEYHHSSLIEIVLVRDQNSSFSLFLFCLL